MSKVSKLKGMPYDLNKVLVTNWQSLTDYYLTKSDWLTKWVKKFAVVGGVMESKAIIEES